MGQQPITHSKGGAAKGAPLLLAFLLIATVATTTSDPRAEEPPSAPMPAQTPDLPAGLDAFRLKQRAATRPASPDLVAGIWRCPKCGAPNAARRLFPEQPPFDKLADVREFLLRVGLGQGGGWQAPPAGACASCGAAPPDKPKLEEAIFFRYLPETGSDAVARLQIRDGQAAEVLWGRLDVSGAYDRIGQLVTERLFQEAFGRVLSVREAWAETASESIAKRAPAVMRAGPGYFLSCRRAGADRREDDRLAAEAAMAMAKLEGAEPLRVRSIRLTADDAAPSRLVPGYRQWLPGQWRQLAEGRYIAEAFLAPGALKALAERELSIQGLSVEDRALRIGEYAVPVDLDELEARSVLAGLALGEGLRQFVWPEAARLVAISRIGDRAKSFLANHEVTIEAGFLLSVRQKPAAEPPSGSGALEARLNLAALAGEVDPAVPGSVENELSGLLGLDPATGKIRPPSATDKLCSCGRQAWLGRKLRPKGFFEKLGAGRLATADWRGAELAWTLDCPVHSRYLPAAGLPPEAELEARYQRDLPKMTFQIVAARGLVVDKTQARLAFGPDISSAMADARLRRGLVRRLKADLPGRDMLFWAPTTNIVIISPLPIEGEARKEMRQAALELAKDAGIPPGEDLDLELRDRLDAEPAGEFSAPPPSRPQSGERAREE